MRFSGKVEVTRGHWWSEWGKVPQHTHGSSEEKIMKQLATLVSFVAVAFFGMPVFAQGGECPGGLCGTPDESGGGGCGCGCGCGSVLVAMTDRGDTYQFYVTATQY